MRTAHDELISLMHLRMNYVRIIAALKFLLNKPIYVPSVEQEQCHHLMEMVAQLGLNVLLVRRFMKVLCKISRETQRKMHAIWYLEEGSCMQFLLSQMNHIPVMQRNIMNNKLNILGEHDLFFCEQLMNLMRFFIRFIDLQIISLCSSLTDNFSLSCIKEQVSYWHQLPNDTLLYKLFLLMNGFVKKEEVCC
ncbi:MAG: chorismate mutase [Legionella sp.]|jgi:chorismate mutase